VLGRNYCVPHQKEIENSVDQIRRARKAQTGQYSGSYKRRAAAVRANASTCHICGLGAIAGDPWQADHLIPGDPNSPLAAAHRSCNARRGNKPLNVL
jgi:hypothetical protein